MKSFITLFHTDTDLKPILYLVLNWSKQSFSSSQNVYITKYYSGWVATRHTLWFGNFLVKKSNPCQSLSYKHIHGVTRSAIFKPRQAFDFFQRLISCRSFVLNGPTHSYSDSQISYRIKYYSCCPGTRHTLWFGKKLVKKSNSCQSLSYKHIHGQSFSSQG